MPGPAPSATDTTRTRSVGMWCLAAHDALLLIGSAANTALRWPIPGSQTREARPRRTPERFGPNLATLVEEWVPMARRATAVQDRSRDGNLLAHTHRRVSDA